MNLAEVWEHKRDQATADFQQYYGLNLWQMGLDGHEDGEMSEVYRAAVLLAQLPPQSRLVCEEYPDATWSIEAQLQRLIEFDLRSILYALGDGKCKKPKPIELPSEQKATDEMIDESLENKAEIDEILSSIFPLQQSDKTE